MGRRAVLRPILLLIVLIEMNGTHSNAKAPVAAAFLGERAATRTADTDGEAPAVPASGCFETVEHSGKACVSVLRVILAHVVGISRK